MPRSFHFRGRPGALAAIAGATFLQLSCLTVAADAIDDRANTLLTWVAKQTGYSADHVKVTVLMTEPRTIHLIAYTVDKSGDPQPEAITAGTTIFLPTWFQLGKNDDVLVHELTHVLQFADDASFPCRAAREKQAYEIQSEYVDETGIGTKPDPFAMFLLQCTSYPVHYGQKPTQ